MEIIRHPKLAEDIRNVAMHYAEISDRVFSAFWRELDSVSVSIENNPRTHHFDSCGLRRANFGKFPYHLLYAVDETAIFLVVLRHDKRHPDYGIVPSSIIDEPNDSNNQTSNFGWRCLDSPQLNPGRAVVSLRR